MALFFLFGVHNFLVSNATDCAFHFGYGHDGAGCGGEDGDIGVTLIHKRRAAEGC